MADNLTEEQRKKCMCSIKSKWTTQESKIHNFLKGNKIKHKMHPKIKGSPDIIIPNKKIAIFLQGCFWHKCPIHYKEPKSKKRYWVGKIKRNVLRDRNNVKLLKKQGWKVVIIWEHDLKRFDKILPVFLSKH